jgi:hypothetical protein
MEAARESCLVVPNESIRRPRYLSYSGQCLLELYGRRREISFLDQGVEILKLAVNLSPQTSNERTPYWGTTAYSSVLGKPAPAIFAI